MKQEILVVLGSPNSPTGELSKISKSRLNYCKEIFTHGKLVLCTGGWGSHFNTAEQAHAHYAKEYLLQQGLSEDNFLPFALSENTVDDAVKIKSIISQLNNTKLIIITSIYHLERAKLIFREILNEYEMEFAGVHCDLDQEQFKKLLQHEQQAINSIKKNGLYY